MPDDPWHWPRTDFAEKTLHLLMAGPARALTMFGPRRTGKTQFLIEDLGPLAESKGHRVVYASFWQTALTPMAVLLNELEKAVRRGSFLDRVKATAADLSPKIKLSGQVPGASLKGEIDLTRIGTPPPSDLLLYLDDLIDRLARKRRPLLLLLDEIQELARHAEQRPLVAALRSSLDVQRAGVRVLFTGSSKEGLRALFSNREAPFFHFATQLDLPQLDDAFVHHLLGAFKKSSGRALDAEAAQRAFEGLHHNPHFFRGLLELMLLDADLDFDRALERQRERISVDLDYATTWLSLSPIQRAAAVAVAQGKKPFAGETRRLIGQLIGEAAPTPGRIQAALRKLVREGIADQWDGQWVLEDPEFAAWMRNRPKHQI